MWIAAAGLAMPAAALFPSPALAQSGAVVQAVPSAGAVDRLNSNLAKLSRSPQDVDALLGAGQAALDLGDVQAANGFYTRANLVNPNHPAAKLGLAIVELALKQPQDAAANFDAADALGEHAAGHLADRGLAYDLTGQQAKAQRDYQAALRADPADAKARVRYAVSLGISGHLTEADQLLEPALKAGDREAWRFRAFIYAMNGKTAEARNITQSVMPKGLADALDPYMVRVPLLTPAQKAAAAHYGDFPANVLRMNPPPPPPVQVAAAPAREPAPVQEAETDRNKKAKGKRDTNAKPPVLVATTPPPAPQQPAPSKLDLIPPPPLPDGGVQQARAETPPPVRTVRVDPAPPVTRPNLTVTPPSEQKPDLPPTRPIVSTPSPAMQPAPQSPKPRDGSLAAALSSLTVPDAEKSAGTPAVDLQALAKAKADKAKADKEAKAKADREAKAKAEAEEKKRIKANPSRIWVQIAAGRNEKALAFDLRRFRKTYSDEIGDESGWYAEWGATNRLLIGPYKKEEKAKSVASSIKKAGGDAFVWESDAGEEVHQIGGE